MMATARPNPPVQIDLTPGQQDFLTLECVWDEVQREYNYRIDVRDPDGELMHSIVSNTVRDRTSLAVLIAAKLAKDATFGFGTDQRPYWWVGNRWIPVEKWLMSLDYSMHVLTRTALVSRESSLTAESMAAWRANSNYPQDGLNLTAYGTCPGIPLLDGILSFKAFDEARQREEVTPSSDFEDRFGIPHDPSHMNLSVFPVYCEVALIHMLLYAAGDDSLLRKFLHSTLTEPQLEVFQKWLGFHLIINQVPNPERMVYLWGSGANGKSQLLWLIRGLVGRDACAELRLSDLKASANVELLQGKVAMLGAEASTSTELERLKSLISREPQNVNPKYRDPYSLQPECLITQASNFAPSFNERSDALTRRVISLHLENSFKDGATRVEDIAGRIIKDEFVILFAFALLGAQRILSDGRFLVPEQIESSSRSTVEKGNPFERFVSDQIEYGPYEIAIPELYRMYAHWCRNEGGEAAPGSQQLLLDELERISGLKKRTLKRGRSLGYAPSVWIDQYGKDTKIVPNLREGVRAQVIQGLRVNNKNGLTAGQDLPANARAFAIIE